MTAPRSSEHIGTRPSWSCRACALPWPCGSAKEILLDEFRNYPSMLRIYMSGQMEDAIEDLTARGGHPPPDLYERFLSWIKARPER